MVLLRAGQSSEDLESEALASVVEHIRRLESEIRARNDELKQSQEPAIHHDKDLAVQDLENHKSIFAPVRRLPNDVLLRIFEMSICTQPNSLCTSNPKTMPWLLGYVCHHWSALCRASPSLWTRISLQSGCSSQDHPGKRYLRQKLLSLSGSSPLHIDVGMLHPFETEFPHHSVCRGDDSDALLEEVALYSHRWSHIDFTICGPVPALQDFSCHLPLLRNLSLMIADPDHTHVCRLFSSAPLLQDLAFCGSIVQWRNLSRAVPLVQLTKLWMSINESVNANLDFYACVKEATMLEDLCFHVSREEGDIVPSSAPFDAQLHPAVVHNNIQKLTLPYEIPSILDRCLMPNLKEFFIYGERGEYAMVAPELEPAEVKVLLRFVWRSECKVRTFFCFRPMPVSAFKSLWKQWSTSLTNLNITVTSATRADIVRELTIEEGEPGILPSLQHLELRTPERACIFRNDSLLKMASSRLTRYPGSFMTLEIVTWMLGTDILSQDIITQMKRLREMRAAGVRVKLFAVDNVEYLDYFETDEVFAQFIEERKP